MNTQAPMPSQARRSGLDAFRAVLRRRHPGLDVVFDLERDDRVHDPAAGEVGRPLTPPQDTGPLLDRVGVAPTTGAAPDEHAVDESGEYLPPLVRSEV